MTIRYDNAGCDQELVGEAGISSEERTELWGRLEAAREALHARWKDDSLGFLACPDASVDAVVQWAKSTRGIIKDQVVIGIGGSSLGARAVLQADASPSHPVRTHFTENVDPVSFVQLLESLELATTLFIVITKSGSTIETMSKFWIAYDRAVEALGDDLARQRFIAVTDPENGSLRSLATGLGMKAFDVPPNVGGRFSVLTPVGFVPLALAGYPIERLVNGAKAARDAAFARDIKDCGLAHAAADSYLLMEKGINQTVMMAYSDQLEGMVEWFAQLWGESLGKAQNRQGETVNVGLTPVKALGVIDQHSQVQLYVEGPVDKHVVFIEADHFAFDVTVPRREGFPESLAHLQGKTLSEILAAELEGTRRAIEEAGRPTSRWVLDAVTPENVGAFIFGWEYVTAMVGELLDIDAFDQPGVELGKKIAHGLLGRAGFDEWASMAESPVERNAYEIV